MKFFIIAILGLVIASVANADTSSLNLNLPSSPQSYASDRIRADGVECQNAIGSSTNLEFGVVGIINEGYNDPFNNSFNSDPLSTPSLGQEKDESVYARITIPIGAPKERINCNALYKLELEIKRMEVQKLKAELNNLRNLKFVGDKTPPTVQIPVAQSVVAQGDKGTN